MSSIEIGELLGTLSRDTQRAQMPLNQYYAEQQRNIIAEKAEKPLEDYENATKEDFKRELQRVTKRIRQDIEKIQNELINVDELKQINDSINALLQVKYEVSKRLGEPCQRLKYKYFGAYRDYLLKTGKKKVVREILENSEDDVEEEDRPVSFERKRWKGKAASAYTEKITEKVPEKKLSALESKIYAAFQLQNGCTTVYTPLEPYSNPPKEIYSPIEFSEEHLCAIEAKVQEEIKKERDEKRRAAEAAQAAIEARKQSLLQKYA